MLYETVVWAVKQNGDQKQVIEKMSTENDVSTDPLGNRSTDGRANLAPHAWTSPAKVMTPPT